MNEQTENKDLQSSTNHEQQELFEESNNGNKLVEIIEKQVENNPEVVQRLMERPVFRSMMISEMHQGPLPPARTLAGYEKVLPGAAERVVRMAEIEQEHRHAMQKQQQEKSLELQKTAVNAQISIDKTGQLYAFIIAMAILVISAILAFLGHEGIASVLVGVDMVGLAAVFITGKIVGQKSNSENDEAD